MLVLKRPVFMALKKVPAKTEKLVYKIGRGGKVAD